MPPQPIYRLTDDWVGRLHGNEEETISFDISLFVLEGKYERNEDIIIDSDNIIKVEMNTLLLDNQQHDKNC